MNTVNIQLEDAWDLMACQIAAGGSVRFMPKGQSMLPMLRQGIDSVLLTASPEKLNKYDLPLFRRENGQFVLHRVVGLNKDGYIMCGDNQYTREYGIKHDQILAVVKGFYRGDEYVDCSDKKYLEYCKKQVLKKALFGKYIKIRHFVAILVKKFYKRHK